MTNRAVWDQFDLTSRVALVTGGGGFLGREMCRCLAEAGASVVVSSRDRRRAEVVAQSIPKSDGAAHHAVVIDHKDESSIEDGFGEAVRLAGRVDVLVNNGQGGPAEDWTNATAEGFGELLANVTGYFLLARKLRDHAVESDRPASVVMIGSMYGVAGSYPDAYQDICAASPAGYHAAKGGVVHLTRHLAVYWATDGVRVNCLSPGPFPNPETAPAEMVKRLESKSPMGRMGRPSELSGALLLLASDAGSYITGHNLLVDGGWTAW